MSNAAGFHPSTGSSDQSFPGLLRTLSYNVARAISTVFASSRHLDYVGGPDRVSRVEWRCDRVEALRRTTVSRSLAANTVWISM
jgi:hypothetical protein